MPADGPLVGSADLFWVRGRGPREKEGVATPLPGGRSSTASTVVLYDWVPMAHYPYRGI